MKTSSVECLWHCFALDIGLEYTFNDRLDVTVMDQTTERDLEVLKHHLVPFVSAEVDDLHHMCEYVHP
jgi:hypothetical protein